MQGTTLDLWPLSQPFPTDSEHLSEEGSCVFNSAVDLCVELNNWQAPLVMGWVVKRWGWCTDCVWLLSIVTYSILFKPLFFVGDVCDQLNKLACQQNIKVEWNWNQHYYTHTAHTPVLAPGVALRRSERSSSWCVRVGLAPAISRAVASWINNWKELRTKQMRGRETAMTHNHVQPFLRENLKSCQGVCLCANSYRGYLYIWVQDVSVYLCATCPFDVFEVYLPLSELYLAENDWHLFITENQLEVYNCKI